MAAAFTFVVIIMLTILLVPAILVFNGFIVMTLWKWFIVPTFAMAPLALVPAMGLSLFISYFHFNTKSSTDKDEALKDCFSLVAKMLFVLFIGWILQMFM